MEDTTRRHFLKTAGLALAGIGATRTGFAFEQEKTQDQDKAKDAPKKPEEKKEEKKADSAAKEETEAPKSEEADWDAAWKDTGSEETRTCPQCGGLMYRQGRTWTCSNCGYSYVE
jgi:ribosomal protein S27AE